MLLVTPSNSVAGLLMMGASENVMELILTDRLYEEMIGHGRMVTLTLKMEAWLPLLVT